MVSVCCLTYNHEKYIRDALEGFVSQKTNFAYEVWIHDDASTDKTASIIKEYEIKAKELEEIARKIPSDIAEIYRRDFYRISTYGIR